MYENLLKTFHGSWIWQHPLTRLQQLFHMTYLRVCLLLGTLCAEAVRVAVVGTRSEEKTFFVVYGKKFYQQFDLAVIGAGIGGGSAVHFMRELFGESLEIVVYEASEFLDSLVSDLVQKSKQNH